MVIISPEDPAALKRFVRSLVQGETFDELEFLKETATVSSADLLSTMSLIAAELQAELTTIVSGEFEGFMKLFTDIGDLGETELTIMADKSIRFNKSILLIENSVQGEVQLLEDKLQACRIAISEHQKLQFQRDFANDLLLLETCLNPLLVDCNNVVQLELATLIYSKIKCRMNSSSTGIPESIATKYAYLSDLLCNIFDKVLYAFLKKPNEEDWPILVNIFRRLEKRTALVQSFRNTIWDQEIGKLIQRSSYEHRVKTCSSPNEACSLLFKELDASLEMHLKKWWGNDDLDDLIVECALNPLFERLVKEVSTMFSPALPDTFHHNFTTSCHFVEVLAERLSDRVRLQLSRDEAFQAYTRSWQLNVYYQLRFRDTAQKVEQYFAKHQSWNESSTDHLLTLLQDTLIEIVSEKNLLRPLVPRFHRLRLQMIARTISWLKNEPPAMTLDLQTSLHRKLLSQLDGWTQIQSLQGYFQEEEMQKLESINQRFKEWIRHEIQECEEKLEISHQEKALQAAREWCLSKQNTLISELQTCLSLLERKRSFLLAICAEFESRASFLLQQSAKEVIKHRRLQMIIREEEEEATVSPHSLNDEDDNDDGAAAEDPEKAHDRLIDAVKEQMDYFNRLVSHRSSTNCLLMSRVIGDQGRMP